MHNLDVKEALYTTKEIDLPSDAIRLRKCKTEKIPVSVKKEVFELAKKVFVRTNNVSDTLKATTKLANDEELNKEVYAITHEAISAVLVYENFNK